MTTALSTNITSAALGLMKSSLRSSLTNVKSSHRAEALARGLGFATNAALLATSKPSLTAADGVRFCDYLASKGFDASPIPLFHAVAGAAIKGVLDNHPYLSIWGFGFGQPRNSETEKERYQRFVEDQKELLTSHAAEEFLLSLALIRRLEKIKGISPSAGSYRLKHIAENYSAFYPDGSTKLGPRYVSNGAFIVAAVHAGFKYKSYRDGLGYDAINVCFNMSKRSVDELDREIRPSRFAA
jgi:hypothetical protein